MLSNENAFARLEICNSCPDLMRENWVCAKCGCFLKIKARKEQEFCPLGKWPELNQEN